MAHVHAIPSTPIHTGLVSPYYDNEIISPEARPPQRPAHLPDPYPDPENPAAPNGFLPPFPRRVSNLAGITLILKEPYLSLPSLRG